VTLKERPQKILARQFRIDGERLLELLPFGFAVMLFPRQQRPIPVAIGQSTPGCPSPGNQGVAPRGNNHLIKPPSSRQGRDHDTFVIVFQFNAGSQHWMISFRPSRVNTHHPMPDKAYLVRFKARDLAPHLVIATSVEFHGEHLVLLKSDGTLAALFVLEIVESWSEIQL
jgi:hypothetical protein